MNRTRHFVLAAGVAAILAAISVHYAEEALQPIVLATRTAVYGELPDSPEALQCSSIDADQAWVHPTALALTVYGDAQAALEEEFGPHGTVEVLPDYAKNRRGEAELRCVADYLLRVGERREIGERQVIAFPFDIEYPKYGLSEGWVSGLTQGLVGQIFIAAYLTQPEMAYLAAARATGALLAVDVDGGGARVELSDGAAWYAEYSQPGIGPPRVLNGHLLALDFLYWMKQFDDTNDWETMFDAGLRAATEQIHHFEGAVWSYYDQESNLATRKYQTFHTRQLERYAAHDATGALDRAKRAMTWQLHVPLGIFQRLLAQPSRMLVFLTGLFFAVYFPAIWLAIRYRTRKSTVSDRIATD